MISAQTLAAVEQQVQHALTTGDEDGLQVLGYGEISTVLRVATPEGDFACKRLPRFATPEHFRRFAESLKRYLGALAPADVHVVPTELLSVEADRGGLIAYCVQPTLPVETLAPKMLVRASEAEGAALIERIFGAVRGAVSPRLGLDAQLSNWAVVDGKLLYLDITTPLHRDERGRDGLDYGIFVASLPWFMRGVLARFVAPGIAAKYFDRRQVLRDFVANLYKERLEKWVPVALECANPHVDQPITEPEVRKYYRSDAQMWAILQRLRRMDRAWQRHVRRRQYPFLLPGDIAR